MRSTYGTRTFGRRSLNESRLLTEASFQGHKQIKAIAKDLQTNKSKGFDLLARSMAVFLKFLSDLQGQTVQTNEKVMDAQSYILGELLSIMATHSDLKNVFLDIKNEKFGEIRDQAASGTVDTKTSEFKDSKVANMGSSNENRYRTGRMVESRRPTLNRKPTRRYL